jgi:hypothetical protein
VWRPADTCSRQVADIQNGGIGKGLEAASCYSFYLFCFYHTFIITFTEALSPFSSLLFFLRGKNLPCGAEPGFHLGPAIQQASAIQTEPHCSLEPRCTLKPCCTLEPHCTLEPRCTLKPCCTLEPRCTLKPCCTLEPQTGRRIFIFVNTVKAPNFDSDS